IVGFVLDEQNFGRGTVVHEPSWIHVANAAAARVAAHPCSSSSMGGPTPRAPLPCWICSVFAADFLPLAKRAQRCRCRRRAIRRFACPIAPAYEGARAGRTLHARAPLTHAGASF